MLFCAFGHRSCFLSDDHHMRCWGVRFMSLATLTHVLHHVGGGVVRPLRCDSVARKTDDVWTVWRPQLGPWWRRDARASARESAGNILLSLTRPGWPFLVEPSQDENFLLERLGMLENVQLPRVIRRPILHLPCSHSVSKHLVLETRESEILLHL